MRGERKQVDAEIVDRDRELCRRLDRVGVNDDAASARDRGEFGDRLDRPDLVVGEHHRARTVSGRSADRDRRRVDEARRRRRATKVTSQPSSREHVERVQHGVVLDRRS